MATPLLFNFLVRGSHIPNTLEIVATTVEMKLIIKMLFGLSGISPQHEN